ncbi:MAG: alkaline phosphatase family protein [Bacteriovoracaceae bacterium]
MKLFIFMALMMSVHAHATVGNRFKKVIWIVFENTDYKTALAQPDFNAISKQGVLLTNLLALIHPSQGNYINMMAGSNYSVKLDSNVDLNVNHLGDLLEKKGLDWRVYAESYPGKCFTGARSGTYVRKHNPFISFTNVSKNPERCKKIESSDLFAQDLANDHLPEFTMYIPDLKNDGHDTGADYSGKWLSSKFGSLFASAHKMKDLLVVITFDESKSYTGNNQVFTVLLGGSIIPGSSNSQAVGHPAILKLIEDEFAIGSLDKNDKSSPALTGFWKNR